MRRTLEGFRIGSEVFQRTGSKQLRLLTSQGKRWLKPADPLADKSVQTTISQGEAALAKGGRLLVRRSGTEPVVRVMAEGDDEALIERVASEVCAAVESAS